MNIDYLGILAISKVCQIPFQVFNSSGHILLLLKDNIPPQI